jgi:hypothetical protein
VDKVKISNSKLSDCKIYSEQQWHPYGFIAIVVVNDGNVVGTISQCMYGAECQDSVKEAERYMINKLNKLYDS